MTELKTLLKRSQELKLEFQEVCRLIREAKNVKERPINGRRITATLRQNGYTKGMAPITGIYKIGGDKYPTEARVDLGHGVYYWWRRVANWHYAQTKEKAKTRQDASRKDNGCPKTCT